MSKPLHHPPLSTLAVRGAALAAIALLAACGSGSGGSTDTGTNTDTDLTDSGDVSGDADNDADAGSDTDGGTDGGSDTETDTETDTDAGGDASPDADAADGSGDTDLDAGDTDLDTADGSGDTDLDAADGSGDTDLDAADDGTTDTGPLCGNGTLDDGEACDGDDLGDASCAGEGFFAGDISCNSDCTLNTDACTDNPCGNGTIDAGEECDGDNLADATCTTLGFDDGDLGCSDTCELVEAGCIDWACGNDIREGDEECDGPSVTTTCIDEGYDGGSLGCAGDCTLDFTACQDWVCGDGVVQPGEQCDDGNPDADDGCFECVRAAGWLCSGEPSDCATDCGDGVIAGLEQCDDGGQDDGDGCDASCALEPGWLCDGAPTECVTECGDGILAGDEVCEPSLLDTTCVDLGFDDGEVVCGASCTAIDSTSCVSWVCGDGVLDPNEECDGTEFSASCVDFGFAGGELACASDCSQSTTFCTAEPFLCGDGTPIDALWVCDTFEDCADGSDEVGCGACAVIDAFEPNDTTATATPGASSGVAEGFICPGELDIFAIDAGVDCAINVRLRHASTAAPLEAFIVDFDLTAFRVTDPVDDASFTYSPSSDGPWFVLVRGTETYYQNSYLLEWDSACGLCAADANEPNDFLASATPVFDGSLGEATLCAGDRDVYAAAVGDGCTVTFTTAGTASNGAAQVIIADGAGAPLVEGTLESTATDLTYTATGAGFVYPYVVGQSDAVVADYAYDVIVDCPAGVCLPDEYEPNDNLDDAAAAGETFSSELCGDEVDVFSVAVTEGCTTTIDVVWTSGSVTDSALALYDAAATTIRSVGGTATGGTLSWTATITTEVYLAVFGVGDAAPYLVDVTTDCSNPCLPDANEYNDDYSALYTPVAEAGSFGGSLCPADLDAFNFDVGPGCTAYVNLFDGADPANVDVYLVDVANETVAAALELDNATENLVWENTGATTRQMSAVVSSATDESDTYTLDTLVVCPAPAACPADAYEVNNTYPESTPLLPGEGVSGVACNSTDDLDLFATSYVAGCVYEMTAVGSVPFAVAYYNSSTTAPELTDIAYFAPGYPVSYHLALESSEYLAPGALGGDDVVYSFETREICTSTSEYVCGSDDTWEALDATGNPISAVPFVADGVSCADDDGFGNEGDWFLVTVDPGSYIEGLLLLDGAATDLDLYILDSTFAAVASSEGAAGASERVLYQSTAGGTYWIWVRPFDGAYGAYTLYVDVL